MVRTLGLSSLWNLACLTYWRWALHDLSKTNPMHEDLPLIVHRVNELEKA